MRVTHVENKVEIEMRLADEVMQPLRARKGVRNVLKQDLYAPLSREKAHLFERGECSLYFPVAVFLARNADVLDEIPERNRLRHLERPLDLVHHLQPL